MYMCKRSYIHVLCRMPVTMASTRRMQYVRDIPVPTRQRLCDFLDDLSGLRNWRHLAGLLGFTNDDIAMFHRSMQRPGGSPTDEMLTTWDYENHTIEELYRKLFELRHARCMMLLRDYVRADLHYLIQNITNSDPLIPEQPVLNLGPPANQFQQAPANIHPGHENQFARSLSPRPQPMNAPSCQPSQQYPPPIQNHPPFQNYQQQQHWGQPSSIKTPSTASYHSSNANLPFQPVDQRMMMAIGPQQPGYNVSPQRKIGQEYIGPQHQGNNLMRLPSEHPLGDRQRYEYQYSNDDNMALPPAASPECLPPSRQPVFQSAPLSNPSQPCHSTPSQASSVEQCLSATIEVPYEKLCKATENFSAARRLGAGAFGEVFHAQLDMIDVAIKKIIKNDNVKFNQSMIRADQIKEIEALTKYRQKNIVCLTAYSFGEDCMCLIFDFMKNGSLEYQLEGRAPQGPLEWRRRHMIAEGAAMGIQYLHTAQQCKPLIHQDIKSANILLDENFVPKIADFGLARPGPTNGKEYTAMKTKTVFGTLAYLAPEFLRDQRKLSKRLDVYSFGIVLLEIVTGEKAGQAKRRFGTHELLWRCVDDIMDCNKGNPQRAAQILQDPLCQDWPSHYMMELVHLAMKCIKEFKYRPEMEEVNNTLLEMGVRIHQEEIHRSSRTHNVPTENTDPLEQSKAMESSDPSQITEDQNQYSANERPGLRRWEGGRKDERPREEDYGGFRALANGPNVQRNINNERHTQESTHQEQDRLNPVHTQMKEGISQDEWLIRERQLHMQQHEYHNQQMHERQYLSPAVPPSGNSSMDRNAAQSQSSMSHSPGSSYPSYLQSSSITSSSDASGFGAHLQGPYIRQPQEYYPGQYQGPDNGVDPMKPHLRQPLHQNIPHHQTRPDFNPMVYRQYVEYSQHHGQHPGPRPTRIPGPQNVGYNHPQPEHYHQPETMDQVQHRVEQLNSKGSGGSSQDLDPVAHKPQVSSSSSTSSPSSDSPRAHLYPKMPTLNLRALSIQLDSSDTSNLTGDTSLSEPESSRSVPQNEGRGECTAEGITGRDQMLESVKEEHKEQSNEVNRREPGENTEPQS